MPLTTGNVHLAFTKRENTLVFENCKLMVDKLEEFTLSTLKTNREWIIKIAEDLLLNETIVYKRIKEILPEELENSLICEY